MVPIPAYPSNGHEISGWWWIPLLHYPRTSSRHPGARTHGPDQSLRQRSLKDSRVSSGKNLSTRALAARKLWRKAGCIGAMRPFTMSTNMFWWFGGIVVAISLLGVIVRNMGEKCSKPRPGCELLTISRWYIRYTYHDSPTQGAHSSSRVRHVKS